MAEPVIPAPVHQVHVPVLTQLETALAGLADLPRPEYLAQVKALRVAQLAQIKQAQIDHLNETTGLDTATAIAAVTDAVVRALSRRAFAKAQAPSDWCEQVGVFALGGYGRGEMNPYSDLDLVVLSGDRKPAWLDAGWAELNTLMWDVKFQVGASQRHIGELAKIIDDDFVTATAVVEQRPVLAGTAIAAQLGGVLERFRHRRATPFLKFKLEELAKRRGEAGASLFRMEPNLKTNPGCLRDVQLLRNMAFAAFGARNLIALTELESITRADLAGVVATNDHLLRLRSLVHFHHGRKQDIFQLGDQVMVAKLLGYADVSRLRAVEHFMKRHYAQVLHVHQVLELATSRLNAKGLLGKRLILVKTRKVIDQDFTAVDGKLYTSHGDLWKGADPVLRIFQAARICQEKTLRFSYELQRQIRANLGAVTDEIRRDRRIAMVFLAILGDLGRVKPALDDLHQSGLLGAWMPEFGNLTCHMQFDSYHQYTVDEHTLIALGNLDAVALGKVPGAPGMGRLLPGLPRKDLLALSLLLHDMGKYMGRGHVARGAMMVDLVADRLGLDESEEDLVFFLVDRHVALSDASRMRNFNEPSFLKTFAERIGSRQRLDYLYCLTWCDARAVGEGILTGWQEALLQELYHAVAGQLEHGGARTVDQHQRLIDELVAGGITRPAAEAHLADLPHSYLHLAQPADVLRHHAVVAAARADGVGLRHEAGEKYIQVAAAVPDRHGLFADVAAALSGHGFDIIDARTWITEGGIVLYNLRLASIHPARVAEPETWTRLARDLRLVARGELDAGSLLDRRRKAISASRPADSGFDDPAVKVENQSSDHWSIVDVHCKDEVGLLSKLCRAISTSGCEIGHACINTMGDVAVDVFYVQRDGGKLEAGEADGLRSAIIQAIGLR